MLERLGVVRTEVPSADFAPRKEEDPWVAVRGLLREGTAMRCPPPPDDGGHVLPMACGWGSQTILRSGHNPVIIIFH